MAILLDGWTSSNNYAFFTIVAHYVHPAMGELGMLLGFIIIISFP